MPGPIVLVERDGSDVAALGRRRLRADDLLDERRVVLDQLRARRSSSCRSTTWTFAPRSVRYSTLPAFALANGCLTDVEGDGAKLRLRHEAAQEKLRDAAELAAHAPHVGRGGDPR